MSTILIKNGIIIDGTGRTGYEADVLVEDGKIMQIGTISQIADQVIDAQGRYVSPGFIDPHSHTDLSIFAFPTNEAYLMQGVTTQICGNCGLAPAPIGDTYWEFLCWEYEAINKINEDPYSFYQWQMPVDKMRESMSETFGLDVRWKTYPEYMDMMEARGFCSNIFPQSGHNHIRNAVMGKEYRPATQDEIDQMKEILKGELEAGSNGFSTGLDYLPGRYAQYDEIKQLLDVVKEYDGCYSTHVRGFDPKDENTPNRVYGVREAIRLSKETGVPTNISHMDILYEPGQEDHPILKSIEELEAGMRQGIPVTYDVIASTSAGGSTIPYLAGLLRPWILMSGGVDAFLKAIQDASYVVKMHEKANEKWPIVTSEYAHQMNVKITTCKNTHYSHRMLSDIANEEFDGDMLNAMLAIMQEDPMTRIDSVSLGGEEGVKALLSSPIAMPCSDGFAFDMDSEMDYPAPLNRFPHPNNYCYAIRQLLYYGDGTLESKVEQMTGRVAKTFRLKDRGTLEVGKWADIVIFDASTLATNEGKDAPYNKPDGIEYVIVNGVLTIDHKQHTGAKAGKWLKRPKKGSNMSEFVQIVEKYYRTEGYNCAECMIHAANEYYHLNIEPEDMKMLAGFGGGMFVGSTCGALVGSIASLSKMIITTKAHDQMDEIRPACQRCVRNFKEAEGGTTCVELKPVHHKGPELKCWETVRIAAEAFEKSVEELDLMK